MLEQSDFELVVSLTAAEPHALLYMSTTIDRVACQQMPVHAAAVLVSLRFGQGTASMRSTALVSQLRSFQEWFNV